MNASWAGVVWTVGWLLMLCVSSGMSIRRGREWRQTPDVWPRDKSSAKGDFVNWFVFAVVSFFALVAGFTDIFLTDPIGDPTGVDSWQDGIILTVLASMPVIFLCGVVYQSVLYVQRKSLPETLEGAGDE